MGGKKAIPKRQRGVKFKPIGYTLKDGQLTPVPDEAEIVKEIYQRYAGGEGYTRIARDLNERRVKKK